MVQKKIICIIDTCQLINDPGVLEYAVEKGYRILIPQAVIEELNRKSLEPNLMQKVLAAKEQLRRYENHYEIVSSLLQDSDSFADSKILQLVIDQFYRKEIDHIIVYTADQKLKRDIEKIPTLESIDYKRRISVKLFRKKAKNEPVITQNNMTAMPFFYAYRNAAPINLPPNQTDYCFFPQQVKNQDIITLVKSIHIQEGEFIQFSVSMFNSVCPEIPVVFTAFGVNLQSGIQEIIYQGMLYPNRPFPHTIFTQATHAYDGLNLKFQIQGWNRIMMFFVHQLRIFSQNAFPWNLSH